MVDQPIITVPVLSHRRGLARRRRSTRPPSTPSRPSCLPPQLLLPLGASRSGRPRRRPRRPPPPSPPPRPPLHLLPSAPPPSPRDPAAGSRRRRSGAPPRRRRTPPRGILACSWRWKGEAFKNPVFLALSSSISCLIPKGAPFLLL